MIPAVDLKKAYWQVMPVIDTDRFAGQCHECPICRKRVWSAFGHARKHWKMHQDGRWRPARCSGCGLMEYSVHVDDARGLRKLGWTVSCYQGNLCYDCACEKGYNG